MLTVIAVAAQTAAEHVGDSPADLARIVADETAEALERAPRMPELARGVVDAGARGFLVLTDALVGVLTGQYMQRRRRYRGILTGGGEPGHSADEACASSDMDYEVMFLLDGAAGEHVATLRTRLDEIGDAVVIVGDSPGDAGERFSVHVHTNEPGLRRGSRHCPGRPVGHPDLLLAVPRRDQEADRQRRPTAPAQACGGGGRAR